jgi:hypothetical protein
MRSNNSHWCKLFIAALFAAQAAFGNHTFTLTTRDFFDANGNGVIDCGEFVVFQAGIFDTSAPVGTVARGRLTVPTSFGHFSFLDAVEDHLLNANCQIGITNLLTFSQIDYDCISSSNPSSQGYAAAILIRGFYTGPAGSLIVSGRDDLEQPATTFTATAAEGNVSTCSASDFLLSKSDGGISARPGQTIPYTLTYVLSGNRGAQAELQESVPANTVFAPAQSSPGWSCTGTAPGSLCTLALGAVPSGGSGSRIFAVTLSATTPSAVQQVANTATIATTDGTPDVDPSNNSATDTTPVIPGVPDLAVTKTLTASGGTPGTVALFTLTVSDQGTGVAEGVTLTETIPSHSSFVAAQSSADWTCTGASAGATCTANLGTLGVAVSTSRTFALRGCLESFLVLG